MEGRAVNIADAPVEERHRRAAALAVCIAGTEVGVWVITGDEGALVPCFSEYKRIEARLVSKYIANAERDGRASRDDEVAELRAYRGAWERYADHWHTAEMREHMGKVLAKELARKGTP